MADKLNVKNFGLAFGLMFAIYMLVFGLSALAGLVPYEIIKFTASFYKGFDATFIGSIIGAIWGFIEGFVIGALVAFFYNKFQKGRK